MKEPIVVLVDEKHHEGCNNALDDVLFELNELNMSDEAIGTIEIRYLSKRYNDGLDLLIWEYRRYIPKLERKVLEAICLNRGGRQLQVSSCLKDVINTRIFCLFNDKINNDPRFIAGNQRELSFDFLENGFYTKDPRYHAITNEAFNSLGRLASDGKIKLKYLYVIAGILGQISLFKALPELSNKELFVFHNKEFENFETQMGENCDIQKIKYKLYEVIEGQKVLDTFERINEVATKKKERILLKTTIPEKCSRDAEAQRTTDLEKCSSKATISEKCSHMTTDLEKCSHTTTELHPVRELRSSSNRGVIGGNITGSNIEESRLDIQEYLEANYGNYDVPESENRFFRWDGKVVDVMIKFKVERSIAELNVNDYFEFKGW